MNRPGFGGGSTDHGAVQKAVCAGTAALDHAQQAMLASGTTAEAVLGIG